MKSTKFEIPEELLPYLDDDPQRKIKKLIVIGLYQERKLTLRQAADMLNLNYREMQKLLANKNILLDFDEKILDEELAYGLGSD